MDKLLFLKPGEQFTSVNCPDTYRNLTVLRVSESGVLVDGEENTGKGWKHFRDRFASSMVVKSTGNFVEITQSDTGIPSIKGAVNSDQSVIVDNGGVIKTKRNKAPKVVFPDGEFSIKALCDKTGLAYHTIMNEFNRQRGSFKEVRKIPNGGKGKPITIWKKK